MATAVHASPYGGSWYPGDAPELQALLDRLFEQSRQRTGPFLLPHAVAFVVPHAGLMYSGTVASAVYRAVAQQKPRRVVLLGFSHRGGPAGVSMPDVRAFSTPLGVAEVDRETMGRLPFPLVGESWVCDHSVEIQLPLIQKAVPEAHLVPLYVGPMDNGQAAVAARALAELAAEDTVFIASSDLTHYGPNFHYEPFPPDGGVSTRLSQVDHAVIEAAGSLDAELFLDAVHDTTVCGYAPVALLLRTLACIEGEEIFQEELDYQTSGDITGDFRHCVSYGALGYFHVSSFTLGREDQELLLDSARNTLAHLLLHGERRSMPPRRVTPALTRRAGVFVSLHEGSRLRGCVGNRSPREPLAQAVPQLALSAALDDPRFDPIRTVKEPLQIEISVLSPMKRVRDRGSFRLGEHGAYLESGWQRALLLPQVARGKDWTAARFWDALAHKSGLTSAAYEDPAARLSVFRAQIVK